MYFAEEFKFYPVQNKNHGKILNIRMIESCLTILKALLKTIKYEMIFAILSWWLLKITETIEVVRMSLRICERPK